MYSTFVALALLPHLFYLVGLFMIGEYIFLILVSNCLLIYVYEFFFDICLYCVLFEIKFFILFTCIFSTHAVMHFVLSVLENIQVDSIKLLSTLATDG